MWKKLKDDPPGVGQEVLVRNGIDGIPFSAKPITWKNEDGQRVNCGWIYKCSNHLDNRIAEWMELPE
jgi:hypothetical protein